MDPLTHISLAACTAMALSSKRKRRAAGLAGAIAGLLPDADVFIRSAADPLLAIEYHRHFTHSFVFQPVTALIALGVAWVLRRLTLGAEVAQASFGVVLAAALTHPFCDWWTSYGTRVFWPFRQERLALDWVSVIDPLVTLPLLVLGIAGAWRRSRVLPWAALGLVSLYLGLATVQKDRAETELQAQLAEQGVTPERFAVRPSFGNIVVWRAVWETQGRIHSAMIRAGREVEWRGGDSFPAVHIEGDPAWNAIAPPGTVLHKDLRRFAHFSSDWLILHPAHDHVIGDARYAMLPTSMEPLWGIRFDPASPKEHVAFENFRTDPKGNFKTLWDWVRRPLNSAGVEP